MIAGFDFLSLTNFGVFFLKSVLRLLFVDQVCSAAENVNVASIHEDGFLLQRRAGAGLVPTCEEQTRVKKPMGRLQIIVGASGCGPTVQTSLICLVLLNVKHDKSDRSHSAGFTAMVDGVNMGLPWRRGSSYTHPHHVCYVRVSFSCYVLPQTRISLVVASSVSSAEGGDKGLLEAPLLSAGGIQWLWLCLQPSGS